MFNTTRERFWKNVDKRGPNECWPWTGAIHPSGHGSIGVSKGDRAELGLRPDLGTITVHRLAWILAYGPIPEGKLVRHKCDIPNCCNHEHLELGTAKQNRQDWAERKCRTNPLKPLGPNKPPTLEEVQYYLDTYGIYVSRHTRSGRLK
jgi:hypothetical protein